MSDTAGHDAEENSEPIPEAGRQQITIFAPAAIVLLSILVYLPSIRGSMIWDDTELLNGKGLGNANTIPGCFTGPFLYHYYRPLTSALFLLDHRLWDRGVWGANTFGYHLTNVLLHAATTALIVPIMLLAFRSRPIALLSALLFAVQPAQVSAVAWIGGRTDSLSTFCIALFCLVLIAGARSTGPMRSRLLAVSVCCYAIAALTKEQSLFLLPLAPLALRVFRPLPETNHSGTSRKANETTLFTFGLLVCAACMLALWARFGSPLHPHWNLVKQLRLIGPTAEYYALLLLAPTPRLNHLMTLSTMHGVVSVIVGCLIVVASAAVLWRLCRTEPRAAWLIAGCLLLLLPVSNIYPMTTQTVAPYRAGSAGLFMALFVGWFVCRLMESAAERSIGRELLKYAPITLYIGWLCYLTMADDRLWKNSLSASLAVEQYDPGSTFGMLETANAYLEFGKFDPAVSRLDRVVERINGMPAAASVKDQAWDSKRGLDQWAASLYGRAGILKLDQSDLPAAGAVLTKGESLDPTNEQVSAGLLRYDFARGDAAAAEQPIRNILVAQPGLRSLRMTLGKILMQERRWAEADTEFTACLSNTRGDKSDESAQAYLYTALARIRAGNKAGALTVLREGLDNRTLEKGLLSEWLSSIGAADLKP